MPLCLLGSPFHQQDICKEGTGIDEGKMIRINHHWTIDSNSDYWSGVWDALFWLDDFKWIHSGDSMYKWHPFDTSFISAFETVVMHLWQFWDALSRSNWHKLALLVSRFAPKRRPSTVLPTWYYKTPASTAVGGIRRILHCSFSYNLGLISSMSWYGNASIWSIRSVIAWEQEKQVIKPEDAWYVSGAERP